MRTWSLPSHGEMDFIPRVCMWTFYILGTFVYIMECTWLDLYRISLSNVSLLKHSSSFWIPCLKAANIEIRGGGGGNIKHQSQFLFLPVVLRVFTVFYVALRTVVQRAHWLQSSVLTKILILLCQWEISIFFFATTFPLVTFSMAEIPWSMKFFVWISGKEISVPQQLLHNSSFWTSQSHLDILVLSTCHHKPQQTASLDLTIN